MSESLPILMHRIKHLNFFSHILGPTIGSIIMGIAIYYSLIGLTGPLEAILVMIPAWIIISLAVIYARRDKVKMEPLLTEERQSD